MTFLLEFSSSLSAVCLLNTESSREFTLKHCCRLTLAFYCLPASGSLKREAWGSRSQQREKKPHWTKGLPSNLWHLSLTQSDWKPNTVWPSPQSTGSEANQCFYLLGLTLVQLRPQFLCKFFHTLTLGGSSGPQCRENEGFETLFLLRLQFGSRGAFRVCAHTHTHTYTPLPNNPYSHLGIMK